MNSPSRSSQRRAQARRRRQHEAHRPDEVRRHAQQHLALDQRLAHQAEPAVLEIAQAAVDQLGGGRRGAGGEIVLLDQQHAQPAAGGVARDAGAVDAAADDGEIVSRPCLPAGSRRPAWRGSRAAHKRPMIERRRADRRSR